MKKDYKLLVGLVISLLLGISNAYSQNQFYLDLDASNSYIHYPDDPSLGILDGATDYTIEAWVFPISGRVNDGDVILCREQNFSLIMHDGNGDGTVADFYFSVYNVVTASWIDYHTDNGSNLNMDAWNHIAIINSSTDNTLILYVNDAVVSGSSSPYTAQSLSAPVTTSDLFIGAENSSPSHSFGGYIDEVRLKSTAEIPSSLQMYTFRTEYNIDSYTAALFHFNECVGATTVNTASGSNASLFNITWRSWRYKSSHSLPFSSAIDWNSGSWDKIYINGAQVYSDDSRNWSPAGIIPATNGFMVEVNDLINHITIPADARLHDSQPWYKSDKVKENTLEVKLTGDQDKGWDYTTITFKEAASEAYEPEYDYHRLFGQASAPQLYTKNSNQEEFCVNTQSIPNHERMILLNIRIGYDGTYTIAIKENTIESEGNIYLEDLKTGILTNLLKNPSYSFQGIKGEEANRFMLHFNSASGINHMENASDIHIYSYAKNIYLSSEKSITGEVKIFNLGGQLVYSQHLTNSSLYTISVPNLRGAYLVQLIEKENLFHLVTG